MTMYKSITVVHMRKFYKFFKFPSIQTRFRRVERSVQIYMVWIVFGKEFLFFCAKDQISLRFIAMSWNSCGFVWIWDFTRFTRFRSIIVTYYIYPNLLCKNTWTSISFKVSLKECIQSYICDLFSIEFMDILEACVVIFLSFLWCVVYILWRQFQRFHEI